MVHSRNQLVLGVFEHARTHPAAPALVWRDRSVSYAELAEMARSAAAAITELPPGPLGVVAEKAPETVAVALGCMAAGRRFLLPAATLPLPMLAGLYRRAGCVHVLSAMGIRGDSNAAELADRHLDVHIGHMDRDTDTPDPVSFMFTTSGSTGTPKIVPLTVEAVDRFAGWADAEFGLGAGRRVLNYAPLNFDLCLLEVWATLRFGGCAVMVDPDRATDGAALAGLLARHDVDVVQAVPMCFELLLAVAGRAGHAELGSVDQVVVTGDTLRPALVADLARLFPRARLTNVYGCTETNDSFRHEFDAGAATTPTLPIGDPLPGVRALLVREDGSVLNGPGTGELLVSTPFQTPGYLDAPDRYVAHPERADDLRYFRSGDLVRRKESGELVLEGRTDFRVKVRGQQVNVLEVEQVLLDHGAVLEVAAVAVPDEHAGHRLHVVVRTDGTTNSLVLRKHCADRLPPAAIPSTMRITPDPLPRTSTGKVDRKHITEHLELVG